MPYTEKLAKYVLTLLIIATVAAVCWLLGDILIYVVLALLLALLAAPLCTLICKPALWKGRHCPMWLGALLGMLTVVAVAVGLLSTVVPLIRDVINDISGVQGMTVAVTHPLENLNAWVIHTFPQVGRDFNIESFALTQMQELFNAGMVGNVMGSVTTFVADLGITLFSVMFIAFFFIKEPGMFSKIICAVVPDALEEKVMQSLKKISNLVSRYFVGMIIEVAGVSLLNFIGLLAIARMGFRYSLGIAFLTGMLNIIPYLGPLMGVVLGTTLSLVIRFLCNTPYGLEVGFLPFLLILAGIFVFTQLIDNSVYQPLIYSNSVKVHPLEIFIVFLVAGSMGGVFGMLIAIPAYTVVREVAKQFLGDVKAIRKLTGGS